MARKIASKSTSSARAVSIALPPQTEALEVAQLPDPIIEFAANNNLLYPMDAINGTTATLTLPPGATDVKFYMAIKGQNEPAFEPFSVANGVKVVDISAQLISYCIGHTVLFSYRAIVGGRVQESNELELAVQQIREEHLVVSRPKFAHSHEEWQNTWWLRMSSLEGGDETVEIKAWPMIYPGQRLFVTVAGNQHVVPYRFIWVALDHVVQAHEAYEGHVFKFALSRHWLSRLHDYSSITAHLGVIWDTTAPVYPEPGDPLYENPLPVNAEDFHLRTTSLLLVDPTLVLNPPHLLESVEHPAGHWQVNPGNTVNGGHAIVGYEGMFEGDNVCAYASGPNYGPVALGCKVVKKDETSLSFEVAPEIIAALFNKTLTLNYSVQFNSFEPQYSPEQVIKVLAPSLTAPDIEEATHGKLNLNIFSEDATALASLGDYAAFAKYVWIWITGEHDDESEFRFDILTGAPATDDWKAKGVEASIPRDKLQQLADCSDFKLHIAESFTELPDRLEAIEGPTTPFHIAQENLVLLRPEVNKAEDDELQPWHGRDGVEVIVRYLRMSHRHKISVDWKRPDGSRWDLKSEFGNREGVVKFFLPAEAVIESMGKKPVQIEYTVTNACKAQTSPPLNLKINLPSPTRLETPNVLEATPPNSQNAILDTRTFTGDARSHEATMWFLRAGQRCWLKATGTDKNDNPHTFVIYADRTITPEEVVNGVDYPVLRSDLDKLKDNTYLTLTFSVATDGSLDENVVCPWRVLVVRVITKVTEDFTTVLPGYFPPGAVARAPTMYMSARSGSLGIHAANPSVPGMTAGNALVLNCQTSTEGPMPAQTIDIYFNRSYTRVRFSFTRNAYYGYFTFYNADGQPIGTRSGLPLNSWIDFSAPEGQQIVKISVVSQQHSYLDNFELYY